MRLLGTAALGLGLGAVAGCRPAPRPVTPSDVAAIRAVDSVFAAAFNARNANGLVALYAADAVLMPPNAPAATGAAAILQNLAPFLTASGPHMTTATDTVVGVGDLAYVTGHYQMCVVQTSGRGCMAGYPSCHTVDEGKYLEVLKRQADGTWKYVRDMWSSNQAAAPMPTPAAAPVHHR